ncbi:MAG: nucleoside triphosphate pyrophosphohydrolase [Clostridiales bacterium]|nr:nucleoside triphosphate pyrophosphohydrolase [Clostridiales bacterium]
MTDLIIIQIGTDLSSKHRSVFDNAEARFVQTTEHPFIKSLALTGNYTAMDDLFREAEDYDELNRLIAGRLVEAAEFMSGDGYNKLVPGEKPTYAAYITLGRLNPDLLGAIREIADAGKVNVEVLPFAGFAESAYAAALSYGLIPGQELITELPANRLRAIADTEAMYAVTEIDSPLAASEVKLKLSEYYPDEYEVLFALPAPDSSGYEVRPVPLYELDRQKAYDAASVLLVPPKKDLDLPRHSVEGLMQLMRRLRAPGGCPWDAEQTHESLKKTLLEECWEVIDAIDRKDADDLCEELGDLLMQIAFHVVIEEERASFTLRDVATGITNKMIFRHPHVFGDVHVNNSDDVLTNWEILKKEEKHLETVASAMDSVPKSFPSLLRAYKIQKKAADVGFDWSSAEEALPKVHEEADEVLSAIRENDPDHIADEVGDLFFAAVNVARLKKVDPDLALTAATDKFERRFKLTEELILKDGLSFKDMTLPEMDEYWEKAKKITETY